MCQCPSIPTPREVGRGRIVREGSALAILSYGARLGDCLKAADVLAAMGFTATVADARFAKPLDSDLVRRLAANHPVLLTVEEAAVGGFTAHVQAALASTGALESGLKLRSLTLPDRFLEHDAPAVQLRAARLDAAGITDAALAALGVDAREARA